MPVSITSILHQKSLRETPQRHLILQILRQANMPLSKPEVFARMKKAGGTVNLVTIYRMLEIFEDRGIVHIHPSTGGVTLCSNIGEHGHHILLSCGLCGKVEECVDADLCKHENRLAEKAGFIPKYHISEIVGVCTSCC